MAVGPTCFHAEIQSVIDVPQTPSPMETRLEVRQKTPISNGNKTGGLVELQSLLETRLGI